MKKILILAANPTDTTNRLRLDEEVREIESSLQRAEHRDKFEIFSKWAVRADDLRRALLDHRPQIVHFSGHGKGNQGLVLEDDSGQMQLVSTQALVGLFKLFIKIECVVLNACYTEVQADAIHQHIDCVIGMSGAISDKAAIKFAVGFYDALGAGKNYQECFEFGCNAIDLQNIPESQTPKIKIRETSDIQLIKIIKRYYSKHEFYIKKAYNLSLEKRINPERLNAKKLLGIINILKEYPLGINKFVVALIIILEQIESPLIQKLEEWAKENIDNDEYQQLYKDYKIKLSQKIKNNPILIIAISKESQFYRIQAWKLTNIFKNEQDYKPNFQKLIINPKSAIIKDETLNNVPQLLKDLIEQCNEECEKFEKYLEQIQIFLPANLMNHRVDCWKIENHEYARTIGEDYEVLLRCSERLTGNDLSYQKWYYKKANLNSKFNQPAQNIFKLPNSNNPRKLLGELLKDDDDEKLAIKVTQFSQSKELGTIMWQGAVPLALWIRQELPDVENEAVLNDILQDCDLNGVPRKVKNKRLDAFGSESPENHIGRHLCLLWDDPNIRIPEQILNPTKLK